MSALHVDAAQENVSFLILEKNEICADISSAAKHFIPCLEKKTFVEIVRECLGLRYLIRKCNVDEYKRRA